MSTPKMVVSANVVSSPSHRPSIAMTVAVVLNGSYD